MLKPLSANIGDLGDYINCKIGQTPQLFHSQIGYTTAPGNALTHTATMGRKGRILGQLLSFPLRASHHRPLSSRVFVLVTHICV